MSPPPPDAQVQHVGEEVGGYVIGKLLTQGGMASVYLGQRVAPGGFAKTVVLKRLRPELAQKPPLLALFLREASLAATLEHPSIVRTLDLAKLGGDYYLVMEYVSGGDLRLLLRRARRRGQRFSAAAVLYLGRELLSALDYAHSRCAADGQPLHLCHRDVSPANILLSTEGEVKLSDFGIAQASAALESAGGIRLRGKIGYMSPEQAQGGTVDARTDLFALAAVLYEVLTSKRLFIGQLGQPVAEIYDAAIVAPSRLCPNLPAGFDSVFAKALAHRPEDRYGSAREFYTALRELTRASNLWLGRLGLAEHLRELCGPDPETWSSLEERTGTAIIPSIADFAELGEDGAGDSGEPEPVAEQLFDHVTVPWPTVPVKDLHPSLALSTDDTAPLPGAALVDVTTASALAPATLSKKAELMTEPAGRAILAASSSPVTAPGQASLPTVGHPRSLGAGIDFDAVTSPAPLVEPTLAIPEATLPRLAELATNPDPPPLTTAQLAVEPARPSGPMTRPLPILLSLSQRLRELRSMPPRRLALFLLGLLGIGAALWIILAELWH